MDDFIVLSVGRQLIELSIQREQQSKQIEALNKQLKDANTTIEELKKPKEA